MAESFLLRPIDAKFWDRVKARAASDRVTLRGLVLWLLGIYVKHGMTAFEAIDGPYKQTK